MPPTMQLLYMSELSTAWLVASSEHSWLSDETAGQTPYEQDLTQHCFIYK